MNKNFVIIGGIIFLPIVIVFVFFGYPVGTLYGTEYIVISICMILFLSFHIGLFSKYGWYIFEPITMVFVLYLFVFFVDPLLNIALDTTDCLGEFDVMSGCLKATGVFMVSYLMLLVGYYGSFRSSAKVYKMKYKQRNTQEPSNWHNGKIEMFALFIWIVSFVFGCIEFAARGMSISYFLTLGRLGSINDFYNQSAFGFLGSFRFSMITAWVYLFVCNKSSLKVKICGILTLEYFILRGFRHALFVLILAPIVYLFIKERKSPKKSTFIILFVLSVLLMGMVQFVRSALREGTSLDWAGFDGSIFFNAIKGNFDIYKTFYGIVMTVPEQLDYQCGMASIVSVITMVIPRYFWPEKPVSPLMTNLWMFCGELAAKSGYAMPNISEYYLDFGSVGCCIAFFIFGHLLQNLKNIGLYKRDKHGLILYSVMFPALFQIVLRGYSPSNVYLLLFYALPVIVIRIFLGTQEVRYETYLYN